MTLIFVVRLAKFFFLHFPLENAKLSGEVGFWSCGYGSKETQLTILFNKVDLLNKRLLNHFNLQLKLGLYEVELPLKEMLFLMFFLK